MMNDAASLNITMAVSARLAFNSLLQRGVYLTGPAGRTMREFLIEIFGWDDAFIDTEVRTIFLNYSPMDGIDSTHIKEGDKITLGSAMPGLVGICMGRDNPYKSFRSGIACDDGNESRLAVETIRVFVKILSTLAVVSGEEILQRGVAVDAGVLAAVLKEKRDNIQAIVGEETDALIARLEKEPGQIKACVRFV